MRPRVLARLDRARVSGGHPAGAMSLAFRWSVVLADAVRDLYRARWGEPTRQAHFEVEEFAIDVLKWDADANPEGVTLYATVGAGARPLPGRDPGHRVEFFAGLLPGQDGIASPLAVLGLCIPRGRASVSITVTPCRPAGRPWPGSSMHTFLVGRSRDALLPPLELPERLTRRVPAGDSPVRSRTRVQAQTRCRQAPAPVGGDRRPVLGLQSRVLNRAFKPRSASRPAALARIPQRWPALTPRAPRVVSFEDVGRGMVR